MGIQETTKMYWIDNILGIVRGTAEAYAREYYPNSDFENVFGNNGKHYFDNDNNPATYYYLIDLVVGQFDIDEEKGYLLLPHIKYQVI